MPSPFDRPAMVMEPPPASGKDELWGQPAMQFSRIANPELRPTLVRRFPENGGNHISIESQPPPQGAHDVMTTSPEFPRFRVGYQWYPGVSIGGAFMYPQQGMGAVGFALPELTPPIIPRFSNVAARSTRQGAIDNARHTGSGSNLLLRVLQPPVSRR